MVDYVVIDTPPALNDVVLAALDKSDGIYAIATMDVASIKNTRIVAAEARAARLRPGTVRLVLNRADSKVLLEPADVREGAASTTIVAQAPERPARAAIGEQGRAGRDRRAAVRGRARASSTSPADRHDAGTEATQNVAQRTALGAGNGVTTGSPRARRVARPQLDDAEASAALPRSSTRSARSSTPRPTTTPRCGRRIETRLRELLDAETTPLSTADRGRDRHRRHRQHPRVRADPGPPRRPGGHRGHGEQRGHHLRRARGQDLRDVASASSTRRTCCASSTRSSGQVGRRIDETVPMVDARLPDGSRVNADHPPARHQRADAHDPQVLARTRTRSTTSSASAR